MQRQPQHRAPHVAQRPPARQSRRACAAGLRRLRAPRAAAPRTTRTHAGRPRPPRAAQAQAPRGRAGAPPASRAPGPRAEVLRRVEAQAATRARAPRAPRALHGARTAHARDQQPRQPRPRRVRRHAREPRIDDGRHALNRHRSLGDVGRKNQLPPLRGPHGRVLLGRGQLAVQRQDEQSVLGGDALALALRFTDRRRARQEDEHVPVQPFRDEPPHRRLDLNFQRPLVVPREVFDGHVVTSALRNAAPRSRPGSARRARRRASRTWRRV